MYFGNKPLDSLSKLRYSPWPRFEGVPESFHSPSHSQSDEGQPSKVKESKFKGQKRNLDVAFIYLFPVPILTQLLLFCELDFLLHRWQNFGQGQILKPLPIWLGLRGQGHLVHYRPFPTLTFEVWTKVSLWINWSLLNLSNLLRRGLIWWSCRHLLQLAGGRKPKAAKKIAKPEISYWQHKQAWLR